VGLERGPLSLVKINEELLERKIITLRSRIPRLTAVGSVALTTQHLLSTKVGTIFADRGGCSVGIFSLHFRGTYVSHLQGRREMQGRKRSQAELLLFFPASLTVPPEDGSDTLTETSASSRSTCQRNKEQTPWLLIRKRTIPSEDRRHRRSECRLLREQGVAWSAQRIQTAVNLGFLDRSRDYIFKVVPQLSLLVSVNLVPVPLLLRKSGSSGNATRDL
jgi:hypothetical protein